MSERIKFWIGHGSTVLMYKQSSYREFYIEKSKSCLHIEKPNTTNMKKTLTISVWLMSTNKDAEIEYYLNDEKVEATITRSKRNDVIKAITGYGNSTTNPTPGFSTSLDLSTYKDGNYKLEVRIIDKNTGEILTRDHRNITLKKYDGRINIEKPNSVEELGTTVVVGGWYLSEYKDSKLEIYLDDTLLENEISRSARPDVLKAISGYGGSSTNPKPGFRMDVDVSDIQDGMHTLKIKVVNETTNEVITSTSKSVKINKNKTIVHMEGPTGTQKRNIKSKSK